MKGLLVTLLMIGGLCTSAQVTISGKIETSRSKPVGGVSVAIKDSYDGSTTDSSGLYSFTTSESGSKVLEFSATGYRPYEQGIIIGKENIELNVSLKELVTELKAVTITAGTFEASESKRATTLNPIDIVTTASANADVTGAIRTLPGTQQVGESEGLFVRGGTAAESKVFIDGTVVNNFYFSSVPDLAQRGRFSPFLFKGTVFSSGGYSAQYGQALSSVLLLESVDLPERSSASLGISTVGLNAGFQQLAKNKRSSWGISYNWTNLLAYFKLVNQAPDYFQVPDFHNVEFNYRTKTGKSGMIKFYGYFNKGQLGLRREDIDSANLKNAFGLDNLNYYLNLSWKEKLGKYWKLSGGASFTNNIDKVSNELQDQSNKRQDLSYGNYAYKNFRFRNYGNFAVVKTVLERKFGGLNAIRFGGEYFYNKEESFYTFGKDPERKNELTDNFMALFAETDLYATNALAAKIGLRMENSSLIGRTNLAPRFSLAYSVGPSSQVSLAYGMFYQKPENSNFLKGFQFPELGYARATHYIANFQKVTSTYTLRTELFYKKYSGLVKNIPTPNGPNKLNNNGYGDAKGFELFWRDRKTFKNLDYWVSYSYLDTKRDYFNYPASIRPNFAASHTASLVVKKFVANLKTQFNASYTFASGRPYYDIRPNGSGNAFRIYDQGITKDYNSLSFSVNYLPGIGKKNASQFNVLVLSVTNVLGNNNVFSYNYSANGNRKVAVGPAAPRFFFVGWFMSFGVDRRDDVINNNL